MLASWYGCQGPAGEVLQVGNLPDPQPGPGEVRVRIHLSGVNPGHQEAPRMARLIHVVPAHHPAQ
jgi:NADPH:quinone reductase